MSEARLSLTAGGHVRYQLKMPYSEGTTHVLFEPRISSRGWSRSLPKPRVNLTRLHGVFAPNSAHRARVTKAHRGKGARAQAAAQTDDTTPAQRRASMTWAQRLKRVFGIDIETCPVCGGAMRIIACIEDPASMTPGDREDPRPPRCESGRSPGSPASAVPGTARAAIGLRRLPQSGSSIRRPRLLRSIRGLGRGSAALKGRHGPDRGDGEPVWEEKTRRRP